MGEYDPSTATGLISGVAAALVAVGVAAREYLKREKFSDAGRDSAIGGIEANDKVLSNLVSEVARLTKRIEGLEARVEHLTNKLADIRATAMDCYSIANECKCGNEGRDRLLVHLKSIVKES